MLERDWRTTRRVGMASDEAVVKGAQWLRDFPGTGSIDPLELPLGYGESLPGPCRRILKISIPCLSEGKIFPKTGYFQVRRRKPILQRQDCRLASGPVEGKPLVLRSQSTDVFPELAEFLFPELPSSPRDRLRQLRCPPEPLRDLLRR